MTGHASLKPMASILKFSKWAKGRVPTSRRQVWYLCLLNVHSAPSQLSLVPYPWLTCTWPQNPAFLLQSLPLLSYHSFSATCLGNFYTSFNPLFSLFVSLPCVWTTGTPEHRLGRKR